MPLWIFISSKAPVQLANSLSLRMQTFPYGWKPTLAPHNECMYGLVCRIFQNAPCCRIPYLSLMRLVRVKTPLYSTSQLQFPLHFHSSPFTHNCMCMPFLNVLCTCRGWITGLTFPSGPGSSCRRGESSPGVLKSHIPMHWASQRSSADTAFAACNALPSSLAPKSLGKSTGKEARPTTLVADLGDTATFKIVCISAPQLALFRPDLPLKYFLLKNG